MKEQITSKIIMVRPANFGFNEETAENNAFQQKDDSLSAKDISKLALIEFDRMVGELEAAGIEVTIWEDSVDPIKPDAIFPNNWFTTHEDNSVVSFPMYAPTRRLERREDLLDSLMTDNTKRYSFEYFEDESKYLEGTGSMILDRSNRVVYACISERTHIEILDKFSVLKEYRKIYFHSVDRQGNPIYHTNVMMALGESFCAICLDSIKNDDERTDLVKMLRETNKEIIELNYDQIDHFAGNMIQLKNSVGGKFIIMSKQAKESLTQAQLDKLSEFGTIIAPDLKVIETIGGGSARCMIAENFLPI